MNSGSVGLGPVSLWRYLAGAVAWLSLIGLGFFIAHFSDGGTLWTIVLLVMALIFGVASHFILWAVGLAGPR
jgi:hypothetical protein